LYVRVTEIMQLPMKIRSEGRSGVTHNDRRAKDHRNTPQCQLTEWKMWLYGNVRVEFPGLQ